MSEINREAGVFDMVASTHRVWPLLCIASCRYGSVSFDNRELEVVFVLKVTMSGFILQDLIWLPPQRVKLELFILKIVIRFYKLVTLFTHFLFSCFSYKLVKAL